MTRTIRHAERIGGVLRVPGDKSISHRALILGALTRGKHVVAGAARSDDVETTARCLRELGCFVEEMPDGRVLVLNHGLVEHTTIDAGNSGTTARLLAGLVAGLGVECTIDGDESLRRRPMERVVEPLAMMGARVVTSRGGHLPMTVAGGTPLRGIEYTLPVASAQVKSAILIAGLLAEGTTTVVEPVPTRDHTERMLEAMGVAVTREGNAVSVTGGGGRLDGAHITVPGDISSAAFFVAAASCVPGSDLFLHQVGLNPTRTGLIDVLRSMGADIVVENETTVCGEPVGDLTVRAGRVPLGAVTVDDPALVASMIDELPVVAATATQAEGETVIRGAGELRRKECDRIAAMAEGLAALGADVTEHDDGLTVRGPSQLRGARVRSFGDHRIVMAMTVAGLLARGETEIDDDTAVAVSYPGFFNDLMTVARPAEEEMA